MGRKSCAVKNCFNSKCTPYISFYAVSKRCSAVLPDWLDFVDPDIRQSIGLKNLYICSDHFMATDFINASQKTKGVRKYALPSASPELKVEANEIWNESELEVGANEIWDELMDTVDEIPLNNDGYKRKKPKRTVLDHNYSCTVDKYDKIVKRSTKLSTQNKELRKKLKIQNQKLKRKDKSINMWKSRAARYRKRTIFKRTSRIPSYHISTGLLSELQRNAAKSAKGARYSNKLKSIAIGLYYCSSKGYKELRKFLRLPSVSLIRKYFRQLNISEGFSENIKVLLNQKVKSFDTTNKVVSIVFDEMTLHPNITYMGKAKPDVLVGFPSKLPGKVVDIKARASSVLVIMVKGLNTGFKQSIGYFFSKDGFKADDLRNIVISAIDYVVDAGLIPKAIVCDQNSTNRLLFKNLGISVESPHFMHGSHKIYTFYDPPHLLKSSRNNLIRHNAVYHDAVAKWDHLRLLHEVDSRRLPRAAPKLSNKHIYLPAFGEMRVGTAAETMSATVAAALRMYASTEVLPTECTGTAKYLEDIDNIFDIFNASKNHRKPNKPLLMPLKTNSLHWEVLENVRKNLLSLRFIDKQCETMAEESNYKTLPKQSRLPWFINGWLLNINALVHIFEDLTMHYGFSQLSTRLLNQDCIENFFGVIRIKNMTNNRPDPLSFRSAYRSVTVNQLTTAPEKGNCEQDFGINLIQLSDFCKLDVSDVSIDHPVGMELNTDLNEFDVSQANNISYTTGWITASITHQSCLDRVTHDKETKTSMLARLKNSQHQEVSGNLSKVLANIANLFNQTFDKLLEESPVGIKARLLKIIMDTQTFEFLCEQCRDTVCDKYVNMLIRGKVRALNESMKKCRSVKRSKTAGSEKAKKLNIG